MTNGLPRKVHFVGIGGAGMSAIAKVLVERGADVSGSDLKRSSVATVLEAMGVRLAIGHHAANLADAELVIASAAIPDGNVELIAAREKDVPIISRGDALERVLHGSRAVIVAGTHGKTTTTSMIVSALHHCGIDPTYLVGGGLNESGTNARAGRDDLSVAESDESDGSFLLLHPHVAVVTNIELDHVDHWSSLEELRGAFESFLAQTAEDGAAVLPANEEDLVQRARSDGRVVLTFGDEGDIWAEDVEFEGTGASFVLHAPAGSAEVRLAVPGDHNVANALAAAGACLAAGAPLELVARGLGRYRGVERRFQRKGSLRGVTIVDDYAHHPTEIRSTLAAARRGEWRRIVATFQPHRYSRTLALAGGFGSAFGDADRVIVTDVYGAGEQPMPGVSGKLVSDAVCASLPGRPVAYMPHREELVGYLENILKPGDLLLTMGAGDVTSLGEELLARWGAA
jgi:UDP-N-acetylmuramate--alanine ligase